MSAAPDRFLQESSSRLMRHVDSSRSIAQRELISVECAMSAAPDRLLKDSSSRLSAPCRQLPIDCSTKAHPDRITRRYTLTQWVVRLRQKCNKFARLSLLPK